MIGYITANEKAEAPKLAEVVAAQFIDSDCRATLSSVENQGTSLNVESDGVLV